MKEVTDMYLEEFNTHLKLIQEAHLVQRQPTKVKRLTARKQVRELEVGYRKWEAELSDERLITRSKTWYYGVDRQELLELLREAAILYLELLREAA
jgi:hypothetical protein